MLEKKTKRQETAEYLKDMVTVKQYKGEPFQTWKWAKELRMKIYTDYARAHELGGLRACGGAWSFEPLIAGMGEVGKDVFWLPAEPYGASVGFDTDFSTRCLEAHEAHGWAADMCAYLRNYIGCMYLNEYAFGGPWPKVDFIVQSHVCCAHAKWKQIVRELEGPDTPFFSFDFTIGPHPAGTGQEKMKEHKFRYVHDQILDAIEQLDKIAQQRWGRRWNDETFIEAVKNDCNATSLWAEICYLNKAVPAPMDEKSMFNFFTHAVMNRTKREVVDMYRVLLDEMKDRVARGVAAVPNERCRLFGDNPPPWGRLGLYRALEQYGAASIGSYYTFYLVGEWEDDEQGNRVPRKTPDQLGIEIKTREDAVRVMIDWYAAKTHFVPYFPELKNDVIVRTAKQWNADAVIMHYNRGCEYQAQSIGENRLAFLEAGFPVLAFEGDMADHRVYDEARVLARVESFMEGLGLRKSS